MLVCNVSLLRRRAAIAAGVVEAAAALDAPGTGNVVFATLVDDPASVQDQIDAYLGEIMVEAANAGDAVDSGFAFAGAIDETAIATSIEDGSVTAAPSTTAWNPADAAAISVSGGGLIATSSGSGAVRGLRSYNSGKYYFECTMTTWVNASTSVGLAPSTAGLNPAGTTKIVVNQSGSVVINAVQWGNLGARASGNIIGIAFDVAAQLVWFRVAPSGNWNGSGTANPATGTGGFSFSAVSGALFPIFAANAASEVCVANFGGSAFSGAVPSGFTSGLPA